jgi:hypothetical protein
MYDINVIKKNYRHSLPFIIVQMVMLLCNDKFLMLW